MTRSRIGLLASALAGLALPTAAQTPPPRPIAALDTLLDPPSVSLPPGTRAVASVQDGAASSPPPTVAQPGQPVGLPTLNGEVRAKPPLDLVMAEIERGIDQASTDDAPRVEASLALRGRSEPNGLPSLYDLTAPLQASYALAGYGRLQLAVTPEYLGSARSTANAADFGTNPLAAPRSALRQGQASATGVGLDLGFSDRFATADFGATPLGFQGINAVGGVEFAPELAPGLTLRATLDRRAVTDSLLSYSGERDPRTGASWGSVTRDHGHVQLEGSAGSLTYTLGAGGGLLTGQNVRDNTQADAGAGFSIAIWRSGGQELRAGLDLTYAAYRRNLQNFSFGSGGYFSPQSFVAGLIPITYRQSVSPELKVSLGGSLGVQSFREASAPVFEQSGLQQTLLAEARLRPGTATALPGTHSTGPAGGAHAGIDYRAVGNLHVGAEAGFDRTGNFTEGTGMVYARYVFGDGG